MRKMIFFQFTKSVYLFFTWALDFLFPRDIYRQNALMIIFGEERYSLCVNMAPLVHFVILQRLQRWTLTYCQTKHLSFHVTFFCAIDLCSIGERTSMTWSTATLFLYDLAFILYLYSSKNKTERCDIFSIVTDSASWGWMRERGREFK